MADILVTSPLASPRSSCFARMSQTSYSFVDLPLLRTDQRQHLRIVVQLGAVPLPIPVGKSLAQNRLALVGHVFVDVGALGFLRQPVDDRPMGRQVGTAHGQLDDLAARGGLELRKFAQAAREIVLPDTVQTVRTGDVYCFCHSLCCVFGICFGQR